ncbi:hypothetical protein BDB13_3641 [Rhodococcus sp. OK302]|nr:hypothetical protein BDB13_3641 [Rhodococcus sp. OK302]
MTIQISISRSGKHLQARAVVSRAVIELLAVARSEMFMPSDAAQHELSASGDAARIPVLSEPVRRRCHRP